MEENPLLNNLLYGPPPQEASNYAYHSVGIFDLLIALGILFLYIMWPLRAIDRTCNVMYAYPAYGEDPVAWRARIIKKYWKTLVITAGIMVGLLYFGFTYPLQELSEFTAYWLGASIIICPCLLLFWPLKIWYDARKEAVLIKQAREQAVEDRIAAGLATQSDMAYYLKATKEKEYWRGYWDGSTES